MVINLQTYAKGDLDDKYFKMNQKLKNEYAYKKVNFNSSCFDCCEPDFMSRTKWRRISYKGRSGKSRYALEIAEKKDSVRQVFVATCQPLDDEMRRRVERHRRERDGRWRTVEVPLEQLPPSRFRCGRELATVRRDDAEPQAKERIVDPVETAL